MSGLFTCFLAGMLFMYAIMRAEALYNDIHDEEQKEAKEAMKAHNRAITNINKN